MTAIEVEIDDRMLERLEEISIKLSGGNMLVDAVAVNILVGAYKERDRLRKDLADIKDGRCVVVPETREHAEAMRAVGEAFAKNK